MVHAIHARAASAADDTAATHADADAGAIGMIVANRHALAP
jgi:hypothetical protein